ncbi:YdeI/OmpD-associated family protein [Lysobacter humi (ex Lee et al. 2017)]
MTRDTAHARFDAPLRRPADPGDATGWTFVRLPKAVSDALPRRGRTTVDGTFAGAPFRATLEPDGELGHWLKVDAELRAAAGVEPGATVTITLAPVAQEPEPAVPADLAQALQAHADAAATWAGTTPVARLDWIHWITSAKQASTRSKRIAEACDKLAAGKRRVCCFDPSGFYSKAFAPPRAAD